MCEDVVIYFLTNLTCHHFRSLRGNALFNNHSYKWGQKAAIGQKKRKQFLEQNWSPPTSWQRLKLGSILQFTKWGWEPGHRWTQPTARGKKITEPAHLKSLAKKYRSGLDWWKVAGDIEIGWPGGYYRQGSPWGVSLEQKFFSRNSFHHLQVLLGL